MPKFTLKRGELPNTLRDDNDGHRVYELRSGVVFDIDKDNAKALKFLRSWATLVVEIPEPKPKPEPRPEPRTQTKPKSSARAATRKRRSTKSAAKGE
tara:strand:- start:2369 stop:2659 length:291 start_codon:yes stop_codon:yes gene_type:complete